MKDLRLLLLGILLILVGIVAQLIPRDISGLSVTTVLEAVGIVIVFVVIFRNWPAVRRWVRARPTGRTWRNLLGFLLLVLCLQCFWAIREDLRQGDALAPIHATLEREGADASVALAGYLAEERNGDLELNAPLREKILDRIAEMGRPGYNAGDVVDQVLWRLREDPDDDVREAAARALPEVIERGDLLVLIADLPDLEGPARNLCGRALEEFTGMSFGEDAEAWRTWFSTTWGGADGPTAFGLAKQAYKEFSERSGERTEILRMALSWLAEGRGADEEQLRSLAGDSMPELREAAATAIRVRRFTGSIGLLVRLLKKEYRMRTAKAQARAIVELDPPRSLLSLLQAMQTGVEDVGREAARSALAEAIGVDDTKDVSAYVALLYRRFPEDSDESVDLFRNLLVMASGSKKACEELRILAADATVDDWDRKGALEKVLEIDPSLATTFFLRKIVMESPDSRVAKVASEELDRR